MKNYTSKEIKKFVSKPLFDEKIILNKDPNYPKISIVTPSYNQAQFLERTILSVLNQNYPNLEYIIIDGGSTDGSIDIIKKYEEYLTYWVSEKDEGQSDALNKGFNIATANWITWINSDDLLLPGALQNAALIIKNAPETKWISGNTVWIDAEDVIIQCVRLFGYSKLLVTLGLLPIGGPSTFFTKDLFREIGGLRKELVFTMDTDLWWRFQKYGARFHHVPQYLMAFRFHKDSKCSASSFLDKQKDKKEVLAREVEKQKEQALIAERYGNKTLYPFAILLYRLRQVMNGNYFRSFLDCKFGFHLPNILGNINMIQRLLVIANEPTPYNIDLFNAFVTAGIELKVFHTKAVSTRNYHYFSQYPVASYPTYIYRRAGFFNFIFALFTLFKKIYSSQFILITGTNSFLFRFSMLICILFKYPFFLWVDHVDLHQNIGNSVILKLIKKHLYLNVFKKAIAILTCGKPGMASVIKSGCPIIKLVDFPYTVDGNRLSLLAKQGSPIAVEALSRANGRIIIFYSGQMIARKGLDLLLMAFRSCIQEMSESAFLVIEGEGPLRLNFEKMAHKFGIFEKSFFVGFRQMDEHASLLGISDIVVVPSKYDPWGIVVHEGMLIKKPVIASDNVGSALDRITHGDNGYIFKSGDSEDLCKYLKLLLKNPELRLIIGKAAGNSAEKWPPSRNVENLLSAFVRSKKLL